jgi:hypothetical protein
MINLNRPTCDDDAIVRQSRIVAFDAIARRAPREPAPTPYEVAVYAFECEDHSAQEHAKAADAVSHRSGDPPMGGLADMIAGCTPVSGAALVDTNPQPDADGWIPFECTKDSVCPVPEGVEFEARMRDGGTFKSRNGSGKGDISWQLLGIGLTAGDFVAYRILKPAALPGWRRGPDVPESERKSGLWFVHNQFGIQWAKPASACSWSSDCKYRHAPPGVREGDAYNPALYGEEA